MTFFWDCYHQIVRPGGHLQKFANGLDKALGLPAQPLLAASGAWASEETYALKIVLYETPYYSTLNFKFEGDRLVFDSEHNVWFGPTKQVQLIGQAH